MFVKHKVYASPVCHTASGESVFFGTEVPYHAEVTSKIGKELIKSADIVGVDAADMPNAPSDLADVPMYDSKDGKTPRPDAASFGNQVTPISHPLHDA